MHDWMQPGINISPKIWNSSRPQSKLFPIECINPNRYIFMFSLSKNWGIYISIIFRILLKWTWNSLVQSATGSLYRKILEDIKKFFCLTWLFSLISIFRFSNACYLSISLQKYSINLIIPWFLIKDENMQRDCLTWIKGSSFDKFRKDYKILAAYGY